MAKLDRIVMDPLQRRREPVVHPQNIRAIVCHRLKPDSLIEEYLVRWRGTWPPNRVPHSWHTLEELVYCLDIVQIYLQKLIATSPPSSFTLKRKSPDFHISRSSPASRISLSPSSASDSTHLGKDCSHARQSRDVEVYNGTLVIEDGWMGIEVSGNCLDSGRDADLLLKANGVVQPSAIDVPQVNHTTLPTAKMVEEAKATRFISATNKIRREFISRLKRIRSSKEEAEVTMVNTIDEESPPLAFKFINESILREGVYKLDDDTLEGCQKCKPDMGQNIGCEYTKWCDCLEYARVDEQRLDEKTWPLYLKWKKTNRGDPFQLPKRFPYRIDRTDGLLLNGFYLDSRHMIYECNDRCRCGPNCKNRNVQWGRSIPLEIFKTKERGWGLRCPVDLRRGQFIDTYRGEIITNLEADGREKEAGPGKDSYLCSLDKFREEKDLKDHEMFVMDGQFMGGPTRFINHSCDPNCRQYTVSYNKHDFRIYELAFFACQDIPKNTELTFDYLDKDDEEDDGGQTGSQEQANPNDVSEGGARPVECRCGSAKCRKWLWM